jgi:2-iminobutanoate/2-iminopropanoate deaminase
MTRQTVASGAAWEVPLAYGAGVIVSGQILFTSGIVARTDAGVIAEGGMRVQIAQVFANLDRILREAGTGFDRIVKFTVYTTDMTGYLEVVDEARKHNRGKPASTVVEVTRLGRPEMLVEVEAVAWVGEAGSAAS